MRWLELLNNIFCLQTNVLQFKDAITGCGNHRHKMPLKNRAYICPDCGYKADRDLNAARNIDRWFEDIHIPEGLFLTIMNSLTGLAEDGHMGWELQLNALPSKCTLLENVVNSDIDTEYLSFVRRYFSLRREQRSRVNKFPYGEAEYKQFVDALEELVETHPGIENRYCDLSRRFDWIKWLLMKCALDEEEESLAVTAITGQSNVLPSARSTQGFPIRWTPADECELIHKKLAERHGSHLT
jgi:hypothetical protein